ncbi:MAG: agmatinase [Bacteroidota bacterium]
MRFSSLGPSSNFLGLPRKFSSLERSRIAVLPAPYEHTVSYGGGAGRGPAAILKASRYVEFYDEELRRELCFEKGIATVGPPAWGGKRNAAALEVLESAVRGLLERKKFVVTLGGEHTVSLAPIRAHLEKYPDLSVIQFDAHSDLRDRYRGNRYSHASVMARVCEVLDPRRLVQVGIRAQCVEEARWIREKGVTTLYAHRIRSIPRARWQRAALKMLTRHVYVTFDVDGLDPSIMPSTGTPEPNGLLWSETTELLRQIGLRRTIVGADIVELAPAGSAPHADLTAARLAYKIMNYALAGR